MSVHLAASPGTGPGTGPLPVPGYAGLETAQHRGVVSALGVHYGTRSDPADRFSRLDPVPGPRQSAPSAFPQRPGALDWLLGPGLAELPQSEDAFHLNVWAPAGAAGAPVVVFLPGGAFVSGAGTGRWYDGERLARDGGAVVVTVNYRLGALAFAGDARSGTNLALDDILQALRWVRDHAADFGGDPGNTTLVGQSAGAFYAYALSQLPEAAGLFRRTALMSLAWQPPLGPGAYAERYALLAGALGGGQGPADAPVEALLDAQAAVGRAYAGRGLGLMPPADDRVPADLFDPVAAARRLHVEALLLTATQDEAAAFLRPVPEGAVGEEQLSAFVAAHFEEPESALGRLSRTLPGSTPRTRLVEAMSLHQLRLYAEELADAAAGAGIPSTTARFALPSPLPGAGSAHCFELPFLFGNRGHWSDAPMLEGVPGEVFEQAGTALRRLVLGFARDGQPRAPGGNPLPRRVADAATLPAVGPRGLGEHPSDRGFRARR